MSFEAEKQKVRLKSGNQCAYPGCTNKLTDAYQIAHIRSEAAKGPRHVPGWNNGNFDVEENLIALCPTHHAIIDNKENEASYPIEVLERMKYEHEVKVSSAMNDVITPDREFLQKVFIILNNYDMIGNLSLCDPSTPTESDKISNLDYCYIDLNDLINRSYGTGITQRLLEDWNIFSNLLDDYGKYLVPYIIYNPIDSNHGIFVNVNPIECREQIKEYRQNLLNIISKYAVNT